MALNGGTGYASSPYYSGGGGGGEGGFINSPPPSQGSPGGGSKGRSNAPPLRPITIRMVHRANVNQTSQEAEFTYEDVLLQNVTIVADVMSVDVTDTNRRYVIEDSTGQLEARYWIASGQSSTEEITEGATIRVFGTLKSFNNKRTVNCTNIRILTDTFEPYYHMLDVIAATLYQRNGPQSLSGVPAQSTSRVAGSAAYTAAASSSQMSNNDSKRFTKMGIPHRLICEFIANHPGRGGSGVNVVAIVKGIKDRTSVSSEEISSALDELQEQGHIFPSNDEHTYDLVD